MASRNVFRFSIGFFFLALPFSGYIAILSSIQSEWQGTNVSSGLGFSAWILGQLIAAIVFIPLIGKIHIRKLMLAAGMVLLIQNLLYPYLVNGYLVNGLMRVIGGCAHLVIYVSGIQLISELTEFYNRGRAVGTWVAASYAGSTFGMLLAGALLENMTWRMTSLVVALPSLVGMMLLWLSVPSRGAYKMSNSDHKGIILRSSIFNSKLWPIYLAYGLHAFELFLIRVWLPTLVAISMLRYFGHEKEYNDAAVLVGLMMAMGAVGVYLGGILSDKIGRVQAAILLFSLSGLCSLVLGLAAQYYPIILVTGFIAGLSTASDSSIYSTLVVEMSNQENVSSNQSVQSIVGMVMGAAAPIVGGAFLDSNGDGQIQFVFLFNASVALIGVILLIYAMKANS